MSNEIKSIDNTNTTFWKSSKVSKPIKENTDSLNKLPYRSDDSLREKLAMLKQKLQQLTQPVSVEKEQTGDEKPKLHP